MATIPRSIAHTYLGPWLAKLQDFTKMDMFLPKNGGTEAVEAAIKVIRKWSRKHGGPNGNGISETPVIISAKDAFHGRALGATSLMDDKPSRDGLEPLLPGMVQVPFNDLAAMEAAFEEHHGNVAGVILEPIQSEAGVIVPEDEYLGGVQELAKKHNVLFALDEIQTGYGRTGANFAWQRLGLERPDLIALGKAMGGGLLPISCLGGREDLMEVFVPHSEGSTFGGYPLAAFVGLLTIVEFEKRDLSAQAKEKGFYLQRILREVAERHPDKVKEVRGRGMLIGVEIHKHVNGHDLSIRMLQHGVYAKETHHTNLRIAPPIVIDKPGMDTIARALDESLAELS
jgi:ornithine--oxo-acid transaminase